MTQEVYAAGLLLSRVENSDRLWLLLQNKKRADWGFPKGHQEIGESLVQCALRECAEETGIAILSIHGEPLQIDYQVNASKHKTVFYFPAETETDAVTISKEHAGFAWCTKAEVCERMPHPNITALFNRYLEQEGF